MNRIHVKPGQTVTAAISEATQRLEDYERAHGPSSMTFEFGIDHVVLNGHRIIRPSGVSRSGWEAFWFLVRWDIINLH